MTWRFVTAGYQSGALPRSDSRWTISSYCELQTNCRNYISIAAAIEPTKIPRAPLFLLFLQEIISDSLDRRRNPGAEPASYDKYQREPRARTEETHALEYQAGARVFSFEL
jgi:hypothetical protein